MMLLLFLAWEPASDTLPSKVNNSAMILEMNDKQYKFSRFNTVRERTVRGL